MNEEIIIHKNQTELQDFLFDFKMSIEEFNKRCIPKGHASAEFDIHPTNVATKDGVSWIIETINNEVLFYKA